MSCRLMGGSSTFIVNEDLQISFKRTVRVPDNQQSSDLPPSLGSFPLKEVSGYADKLPESMASKGGLFFPTYQSEAMWIDFKNCDVITYQIKIYVGGVNAISGEPFDENAATRRRREEKMAAVRNEKDSNSADHGANTKNKDADKKKGPASPLQDYVVVPGQYWLDGIANGDGTVRQFIAMPFGSGLSVESQITGPDTTGGIQFEITPYSTPLRGPPVTLTGKPYQIFVWTISGRVITPLVCATTTFDELKDIIAYQLILGTFRDFYLVFGCKHMTEGIGQIMEYLSVGKENSIDMSYRLRGGEAPKPAQEMSVAAGGKIKQVIHRDTKDSDWLPDKTTVVNIQILNSDSYLSYEQYGYPFFKVYEEPSGVAFSKIKSVAAIDQRTDVPVVPRVVDLRHGDGRVKGELNVGLANPNGPLRPFRTVADLEKEMANCKIDDR